MENPSTQFKENIQSIEKDSTAGCNISLETSFLENNFPAEIILSSLPCDDDDKHRDEDDDKHRNEDNDKLLIVDEELSDSDEELVKKNTSEY